MGNLVWDEVYKEQGEVQKEVLPTVKSALPLLNKYNCKKVLDLCCGTGRHSIYLSQNGIEEVYACDISNAGIEIASKKAVNLNLNNINFKVSDITNISYDDNFFDAVICVWSLGIGKYEDLKKSVDEIYRVLKPNGLAIMDFQSVEDKTYGKGIEIEENTFIGGFEGLDSLPSHYCTKEEIETLTHKFNHKLIEPFDYNYFIGSQKEVIKAFYVQAFK